LDYEPREDYGCAIKPGHNLKMDCHGYQFGSVRVTLLDIGGISMEWGLWGNIKAMFTSALVRLLRVDLLLSILMKGVHV
jgi:hypothetical protein